MASRAQVVAVRLATYQTTKGNPMTNKTLYVANENGDWWALSPDDVIYVMRPDQIPADVSDADDKFEQVIMEHGTTVEGLFDDLTKVVNS